MNFARRLWPKSRGKRWITVGALMVLFLSALWTAAFFAMERQVNEAWDFTDRFGLSNDFAELLGPRIPPEENAAVPFQEAVAIAIEALAKSPEFRSNTYSITPEMLSSPIELMNDSRYESQLVEVDRRSNYRPLIDDEYPIIWQCEDFAWKTMRLTSTEIAIARRLAIEGRTHHAVQRLLRYSRICRKWQGKEPTLWGVDTGVRAIFGADGICAELSFILRSATPLGPELHDAIDAEVAASGDILRDCLFAAQAERLAFLYRCQYDAPLGDSFVFLPYAYLDDRCSLEYFNQSMLNLTQSGLGGIEKQKRLEQQVGESAKDFFHRIVHPVSSQGLTQLVSLHSRIPFALAMSRCLRIVNALARKGDFTAPLESLGLPPDCLIDPYDGKPLRTKRTPDGPIVYSVGIDLKDDDGESKAWRDYGFGPRAKAMKK